MKKYLQALLQFNASKVDINKGIRQMLLMLVPLFIGYFSDHFSTGLLVATGTLAHIYVFGGPLRSRLTTVVLCSIGFSLGMMLGTLTVDEPIIFGILLLIFAVVPYYIFSTLNIPGPSSIFFIVSLSLPINLPHAPDEALFRGCAMLFGGFLATVVVLLTVYFSRNAGEVKAVQNDYNMLKQLIYNFDDPNAFMEVSRLAVDSFRRSDKALVTFSASHSSEPNGFQRLLLLHNLAQAIHSELLDLNENGHRPLPPIIKEMIDYVIKLVYGKGDIRAQWQKEVQVEPEFQMLVNHIFKVDEMMRVSDERIKHEMDVRLPIHGQTLLQNLSLESYKFRNTLRYIVIMAVSIIIALMFDFDKAYWIPISTHTVLLGSSTWHSFERAGSRGVGTILGVLVLSVVLLFSPPIPVAIILLAVAAGLTEMIVGANYFYAVIFITIQVLLLNGLASGNLTILNALPRLIDVFVGIVIAVIGVMILGRKTASSMIPKTIVDVIREEAVLFHYLFSTDKMGEQPFDKHELLHLSIKISNMLEVYNSAKGELFSKKRYIQAYYANIHALEELSLMLSRAMYNDKRKTIDAEPMGQYLLVFENLAKYYERGQQLTQQSLPALPQYVYIRNALLHMQHNCLSAMHKN